MTVKHVGFERRSLKVEEDNIERIPATIQFVWLFFVGNFLEETYVTLNHMLIAHTYIVGMNI